MGNRPLFLLQAHAIVRRKTDMEYEFRDCGIFMYLFYN